MTPSPGWPESDERAAPRPRGRPSRATAEQMERALLESARDLFITQGYDLTTMDAVATQARASKRTLYNRFASKAALFEAVVADYADRVLTPMETKLAKIADEPAPPLREQLLIIGILFVEQALLPETQALDRVLSTAADEFPEVAARLNRQGFMRATSLVSQLLAQAGASRPDIGAKAFYSLLVLAPMREKWGVPDAASPDVDRIVDFVLAGADLAPNA